MKKYIGVKIIEAEPINLGEYNKFKGWKIPDDEDPNKEGYKVKYSDDYISWSPKEVFEEAYIELFDGTDLTAEEVKNYITKRRAQRPIKPAKSGGGHVIK